MYKVTTLSRSFRTRDGSLDIIMVHHDTSIHQVTYNVGYCLPATMGISQHAGIQLTEPDQTRGLFKREAQHTEPKKTSLRETGIEPAPAKHELTVLSKSFELIVIKIRGPYKHYLNMIDLVSRCVQMSRSNRKAGYS